VGRIIDVLGRVAIAAVVLFFAYVIFAFFHIKKHGCNQVLQIAQDPIKVSYLDVWASKHIVDQGFYDVSGMNGEVYGSKNGKYYKIEPLPNPEISGIPLEFLRLSVYKSSAEYKDKITTDNLTQLDFGHGRDQVIILKNGTMLSEYRGTVVPSRKIVKVNSSTYAYCADSRF